VHHLTVEEEVVLDLAGALSRAFAALGEYHFNDHDDVVAHIHAFQRLVSARVAYQTNPDRFPDRARPATLADFAAQRGRPMSE
jgi:hypothetical protein